MRQRIADFWTVVVPSKSPSELDAEQYLFYWRHRNKTSENGEPTYFVYRGIRFHRSMLLIASVISQFVNGSLYAWSLLNKPLDLVFFNDSSAGRSIVAYYLACGCLGIASALFGPYIERHGPRAGLLLGGGLIVLGHLIAAMSVQVQYVYVFYLGYGVLVGSGVGISYIAPISALQKWYPDLRGTAAGVAVCGFGLGASGWGQLYLPMIQSVGLTCMFILCATLMGILHLASALAMRTPPPNYRIHGRDMHGWLRSSDNHIVQHTSPPALLEDVVDYVKAYDYLESELDESELYYHTKIKYLHLHECLLSIDFAFLYVSYLACVASGIIVLSRVANMATTVFNQSENDAATLVTLVALCNFLGRILLPFGSEVIIRLCSLNPACGRKLLFVISLVTQLIILLFLPDALATQSYDIFQGFLFAITFVYGGTVGGIPSLCTDMYGVYNTGTMHGIILTCWSLCAVAGGITFNELFNTWQYQYGIIHACQMDFEWLTIIVGIGCGTIFLVRTNPADRFSYGWQMTVCGHRIFHIKSKKNQSAIDTNASLLASI